MKLSGCPLSLMVWCGSQKITCWFLGTGYKRSKSSLSIPLSPTPCLSRHSWYNSSTSLLWWDQRLPCCADLQLLYYGFMLSWVLHTVIKKHKTKVENDKFKQTDNRQGNFIQFPQIPNLILQRCLVTITSHSLTHMCACGFLFV